MVLGGRKILAIVAVAAALLAVLLRVAFAGAGKDIPVEAVNTNWGLSFREAGKPPVGNASSEHLAQYGAFYLGDTKQKRIYLTFDAGYENGCTASILDTLKLHDVKAAFFLVGNYLKTSPDLVRRMNEEGHIVGNHTFSHPDMSGMPGDGAFEKEISSLEQLYKQITGAEISRFYRPPQGKYSDSNLMQARSLGYKTVFWSLAYVDWYDGNQPTKAQAFDKLLPRIHPGAVVLLHSTSRTNAEILEELIAKYREMGYEFKGLEHLTG